jgi:2-polyprenyl-3-methyl-5-hydroxy-6-metoxy-1,4-benzoquinol methylase
MTGMTGGVRCVFCGASTAELSAVNSAQVRCNVWEFGDETYTVWRCAKCGSLHATEPIDPDRYYQHYARLCRLEYYSFMKVALRKRMRVLKHSRLKRGSTLLDYGCGSGHFVRYAREHGVRAKGYDPYSEEFGDISVLDGSYDFVTAQDVLEHMEDPHALVADLKSYVAPNGCIAIGTPNADVLDLHNPLDLVGPLHQPFHRHIPSAAELQKMASEGGWKVIEFNTDSFVDTRIPFFNTEFLWRYLKCSGGFLDVGSDGKNAYKVIAANPSLIWWGLFGSFFSRKTDMVVAASAPS